MKTTTRMTVSGAPSSPPTTWREMVGDVKLADATHMVGSIASVPGTPAGSLRFSAIPAGPPTTSRATVTVPLMASSRSVPHGARSPSPGPRSPRSPGPSFRATSPRPESPRLSVRVPMPHVANSENNSMFQSALSSIQEQFRELKVAWVEEKRARQQLEVQLETQIKSVVADVVACKDASAAIESTVMEDRRFRQQMQSQFQDQFQRLAKEVLEERQQRQQMQAILQTQIQGMQAGVAEERHEVQQIQMHLTAQVQLLTAELEVMKTKFHKNESPPEDPIKVAVRMIEKRGNLRISYETGHVTLLKPFNWMPKSTHAELRDIHVADAICHDLAEISKIFRRPMTIEVHTKGGETHFWQTLTEERAQLIAGKMILFGADPSLLNTKGLPGRQGKNVVTTEISLDIRESPN